MSLFRKITQVLSPAAVTSSGVRSGTRTYVIDPSPVDAEKGRRDRMAPGAQVKFLQRVSRFAEKETVALTVVLGGKELRAVKDGEDFQGVRVYFAEQAGFAGVVTTQVRSQLKRGPVTLITDDAKLEGEGVSAGADPMRLSTFLKAFEGGGGSREGGGKSSRNRSRSRNRDRGGDRDRKRRNDDQPRMSRQGGSDTVAVRDLLDLVE